MIETFRLTLTNAHRSRTGYGTRRSGPYTAGCTATTYSRYCTWVCWDAWLIIIILTAKRRLSLKTRNRVHTPIPRVIHGRCTYCYHRCCFGLDRAQLSSSISFPVSPFLNGRITGSLWQKSLSPFSILHWHDCRTDFAAMQSACPQAMGRESGTVSGDVRQNIYVIPG